MINHNNHDFKECKQYKPDLEKEKEIKETKKNIKRYTFHYERFQNHSKSRDICKKKIPKHLETIKLLHEIKKYPEGELKFYKECSDQII